MRRRIPHVDGGPVVGNARYDVPTRLLARAIRMAADTFTALVCCRFGRRSYVAAIAAASAAAAAVIVVAASAEQEQKHGESETQAGGDS
jgi:hypothetical protein